MGERNITLFALHLHNNGDVQLGPREMGSRGTGSRGVRERLRASRGSIPIPLAAAAVGLFAVAVLARRVAADRT